MKKLALALMCLVSVAFFASCDPEDITNPEPTIAILVEEGFVTNNSVVDLETPFCYGFMVASNPDTQKELSSLIVKIGDDDADTIALTGTDYIFRDTISLRLDRDIIGETAIVGTVTDVDGKSATTTINLSLNEAAQDLEVKNITWARRGSNLQGNTQEEMAAVGLQWISRDAFHANIRPLNNCTLYVIENNLEAFENVVTDLNKAAYFDNLQETARPVEEYRNISVAVTGDRTYNDILAVIDAEGNKHLVLIGVANVQTGDFGVHTTITGQVK